jgi:pyrimidine operon attenuation protein/uracil phosphoribosyltransferase
MNKTAQHSKILNHIKIQQKISRIAYQIYEDHYLEEEIIVIGIVNNGYLFAEKIVKELKKISPLKITLAKLTIDKKEPLKNEIQLSISAEKLENASLIVVDDVLNSGRTMMYSLNSFLKNPVKSIAIAVLVDRSHKRFPVKANYVGLSLSTTLQDHIEVDLENPKDNAAYLV